MRRLHHFSFTATAVEPRQPAPLNRPAAPANVRPSDEMWRSRRVLSGSDWMDAWVLKPTRR
jgi:hypothetical protein